MISDGDSKKTLSRATKKEGQSSITVESWGTLHAEFAKTRDSGWIFRGVSSPTHTLIPGIGRIDTYGKYDARREARIFDEFKLRAVSLAPEGRFDDWGWLAYAQHIGVPTRLLDWSTSPLIALYFALEAETKTDRVVYATKYSKYVHEVNKKDAGPLNSATEGRFTAPLAFDRIRAQRGVFTIHPVPTQAFSPPDLRRFIIPKENVKDFRMRLFKYGIDHWHIYPDMEGLGKQIAWQVKNGIGLGRLTSRK